jgi:cytoskeletal protein RodZ
VFEIGNSLREARVRQQLELTEVEQATKIRARYLRALEEESFEALPAQTYVKGFLRTYADSLGMDGQLYVDEYNSRFVTGEDEPAVYTRRSAPTHPRRRRHHERHESRLVAIAVGAIVVLTALVIAAWKFGGPTEPKVQGVNLPAAPAAVVARGVSVTATNGASFMEVRRGSLAGKPLYRGTLERGQTKRFPSKKLSLTVASPRNVVVKVAGVRVRMPTSGHLVIAPSS